MYRFISLSILASLALLLLCFYMYMTRNFNYWKTRGITFFKPLPFVGNFKDVFLFQISVGKLLHKFYDLTTEPFVGLFVFGEPYLMLRSPELIKHVLVKDFNCFFDRCITTNEKSDPIGSYMLFLIKNPEWKALRSKVTPLFTSGKLKAMFGLIEEVGKDLKNYISEVTVYEEEVDAKQLFTKYSTDVIASCAFGLKAHSFEDEDAQFRSVGNKIFGFSFSRGIQMTSYFFLPYLVKLFGFKFLDSSAAQYLKRTFLETMEQRKGNIGKRNDVVDMLIELNGQKIDGVDDVLEGDKLLAQAAIFFLGAFETTSTTIAACLHELCLQPKIQHRLRNEIRQSLLEHKGNVTIDIIKDMKYLDMVISEILRKYPTLPFLDRRAMVDYRLPGTDVIIEKGTPILIPLFGLHLDPQYFPDPMKFDPERFSDENVDKIVPFSYMPFGKGPHNCVGSRFGLVSTKLALIHILSEFEVEPSRRTTDPIIFDPKAFVIASMNGFPMKFKSCKV